MLLPEPQRRGDIQFWIVKSLSYDARLHAILVLITAGFVLQAVSLRLSWFAGGPLGALFLFAGTLLSLVKGYTNKPPHLNGPREWRSADVEHLARIIRISRKARTWDRSFLDITCGPGCLGLLLVALAGFTGFVVLLGLDQEVLAGIWILDLSVLLLPHWVTGVRRILTNDPLTIKASMMLELINGWQTAALPDEKIFTHLEILGNAAGSQLPQDAKLVLHRESLGDAFLGMQTQIVINNVQGSDYPYLYCVLVAHPELELNRQLQPQPPPGIVAEAERQDDVDILVIRQHTTRTSGYHTNSRAAGKIFNYAVGLARQLQPCKRSAS